MPQLRARAGRQEHAGGRAEGDAAQQSIGEQPAALAFDGTRIWSANESLNTVNWLRASDGEYLGTAYVGPDPQAIAFDGEAIWVTSSVDNQVTRLRASDGALLDVSAVGVRPTALAFDGANMWVVNNDDHTLSKH